MDNEDYMMNLMDKSKRNEDYRMNQNENPWSEQAVRGLPYLHGEESCVHYSIRYTYGKYSHKKDSYIQSLATLTKKLEWLR